MSYVLVITVNGDFMGEGVEEVKDNPFEKSAYKLAGAAKVISLMNPRGSFGTTVVPIVPVGELRDFYVFSENVIGFMEIPKDHPFVREYESVKSRLSARSGSSEPLIQQ